MEINYIENNTWVLGNTRFISRVEHDISLVRISSVEHVISRVSAANE